MNTTNRIVTIALSLGLLLFIFDLVRTKKLKEKYALLWILTGLTILSLAVFPNLLYRMTHVLGIVMPVNTVFFFGLFFIILINLHFSLVISHLNEQQKKMIQRLALLEEKKV